MKYLWAAYPHWLTPLFQGRPKVRLRRLVILKTLIATSSSLPSIGFCDCVCESNGAVRGHFSEWISLRDYSAATVIALTSLLSRPEGPAPVEALDGGSTMGHSTNARSRGGVRLNLL